MFAPVFGKDYVLVKSYVNDYNPTPMGFPRLNKVSIK